MVALKCARNFFNDVVFRGKKCQFLAGLEMYYLSLHELLTKHMLSSDLIVQILLLAHL